MTQDVAKYTTGEHAKTAAKVTGVAARKSTDTAATATDAMQVTQQVAKFTAGETAKTASAVAGTSARQAAETTSSATGAAMQATSMLKSVFGSAGQAFAGVFGFMSPIMGPAAAGPAAAAEATVISTGSGLISAADIGMWNVPKTQLALIHNRELVMPASQADSFRAMLSGQTPVGGRSGSGMQINPALHLNVNAMDGASVKQFMRSNSRTMMQSLHSSVRSGAHLGLKSLS